MPLDKSLIELKLDPTEMKDFGQHQELASHKDFRFKNTWFIGPVSIPTSATSIFFHNCYFEHGIMITPDINKAWGPENFKVNCPVEIVQSDMEGSFVVSQCNFTNRFYMEDCRINHLSTGSTVFDKNFVITQSIFKTRINFVETQFLQIASITQSIFEENCLFTNTILNDTFSLQGSIFNKGLDLSLAVIRKDISIFSSYIFDETFKTSNPNTNDLERDINDIIDGPNNHFRRYSKSYYELLNKHGEIPIENKRETYRILKNELLKSNNHADAVSYRVREYRALWVELIRKIKVHKWHSNAIADLSVLTLNAASNWYRSSYILGILFTLAVGATCFNGMLSHIGNYSWTSDISTWEWEYFVQFMIPTHRFTFMDEIDPDPEHWFYIWDFIGRIAVGYGIYQTVQAFRKFK
jgi:hypothetical protein